MFIVSFLETAYFFYVAEYKEPPTDYIEEGSWVAYTCQNFKKSWYCCSETFKSVVTDYKKGVQYESVSCIKNTFIAHFSNETLNATIQSK